MRTCSLRKLYNDSAKFTAEASDSFINIQQVFSSKPSGKTAASSVLLNLDGKSTGMNERGNDPVSE